MYENFINYKPYQKLRNALHERNNRFSKCVENILWLGSEQIITSSKITIIALYYTPKKKEKIAKSSS